MKVRVPPETFGQLDRRRSSRNEPFAGDRESRLRAISGPFLSDLLAPGSSRKAAIRLEYPAGLEAPCPDPATLGQALQ